MSEQRWRTIQSLFEGAVEQPRDERKAYVRQRCPTDADLRDEVLRLLDADEMGHALLDAPAVDLAATAPPPDGTGTTIGPYRLRRRLGEGGMGAVFLAERDRDFQQQVALKLVKRWMLSEELSRRFEAERQILASLDHPNIARLLDGGVTDDGQPYFTMEYVEGQPITTYCDERGLSIDARLRLFCTVCRAVQHAQQNLIIHRDLKPSNILVSSNGAVKLLDFGIAKVIDSAAGAEPRARTGVRLLTPGYGAPEQIRGQPVSTATDVFALGVVLYELLTGESPHAGSSVTEIEAAVLETVPAKPSAADFALGPARPYSSRALRGDLDTICLTALRKESAERYPSASALLDDVVLFQQRRPIRARPLTLSYQWGKFIGRNRGRVVAALAAVIGVALLVGVYTVRLAQERDRAQLEATKAAEVARFVTDLFAVSDPQRSLGATITARELLDRGARRLDSELKDQPEVRAAMLSAIGRSYRGLGLFERATEFLEAARQIYVSLPRPRPHRPRRRRLRSGRGPDRPRSLRRSRSAVPGRSTANGARVRSAVGAGGRGASRPWCDAQRGGALRRRRAAPAKSGVRVSGGPGTSASAPRSTTSACSCTRRTASTRRRPSTAKRSPWCARCAETCIRSCRGCCTTSASSCGTKRTTSRPSRFTKRAWPWIARCTGRTILAPRTA